MRDDNILYTGMIQATGGIIADFCTHPLHTTWTTKQSHYYHPKMPSFTHILATQNITQLYAGFSPQAISAFPATFLYLQARTRTVSFLGGNDIAYAMQGPIAVSAGMTLWGPATRITVLKQSSNQSIPTICKNIYKAEHIKGFYRGTLGATVSFATNDAVGSWLQMQIFNYFLPQKYHDATLQIASTALAFAFASLITAPIEMVVTHQRLHESNPTHFPRKKFTEVARRIYTEKGARGFFRAAPAWMFYQTAWHMVIPLTNLVR